jgi:hypothetical protein
MSVQAMSWVIDNSQHKGGSLLVLMMIANHAKSDGSGAWPSTTLLASECRMSERQVRRIIDSVLEPSGELTVQRRIGKPHIYDVPGVRGEATTPDNMSGVEEPGMSGAPRTYQAETPDISDTTPDIAVSDEPSKKQPKATIRGTVNLFDRFWNAYPKHSAKDDARKAFAKRLKAGTDPEILIAGAERYAAWVAAGGVESPQFVPYPATWLNRGQESDDLPAPHRNGNGRPKGVAAIDAVYAEARRQIQ